MTVRNVMHAIVAVGGCLALPAGALAQEERHIPTPQDRLRSAFSSEIPEDVLEPTGRPALRAPQRGGADESAHRGPVRGVLVEVQRCGIVRAQELLVAPLLQPLANGEVGPLEPS